VDTSLVAQQQAITLRAAARALDVDEATVRRWIRDGAPCERLGARGPGRGALVVLEKLKRWRAKQAGIAVDGVAGPPDFSAIVACGLYQAFTRGTGGKSKPTWEELFDQGNRAALILSGAYVSIMHVLTGREPDPGSLPPEIQFLHKRAISIVLARTSSRS
jgi:hypothetical protein